MTEKRALENAIQMWENLREINDGNPYYKIGELKSIYFNNILKNNSKYNTPICNCYLCEFTKFHCNKCPVKNWSKYRKYGEFTGTCTDYNSVYDASTPKATIEKVLELLKETYNDLYNN